MTINRVQGTGFAQIANAALRDKRLSFKARGVLAMVLSYSDGWDSPRGWLESMSDRDGKEAIQSALNELTVLGYREVNKIQKANGTWSTEVIWLHTPGTPVTDGRETRLPVTQPAGEPGGLPEHHLQNTNYSPQAAPTAPNIHQFALMPPPASKKPTVAEMFDMWWEVVPNKKAKGQARKTFAAKIKTTSVGTLIDATVAGTGWNLDRPPQYRPHPSTWLNGECWADEETPSGGVPTGPLGMPDWNFKEEPIDYAALDAQLVEELTRKKVLGRDQP